MLLLVVVAPHGLLFISCAEAFEDLLRKLGYAAPRFCVLQHTIHYILWADVSAQIFFQSLTLPLMVWAAEEDMFSVFYRVAAVMTVRSVRSPESVQVCPEASMPSKELGDVVPDLSMRAIDPCGDVWDQAACPCTLSGNFPPLLPLV